VLCFVFWSTEPQNEPQKKNLKFLNESQTAEKWFEKLECSTYVFLIENYKKAYLLQKTKDIHYIVLKVGTKFAWKKRTGTEYRYRYHTINIFEIFNRKDF
jgi:hypothetical protein